MAQRKKAPSRKPASRKAAAQKAARTRADNEAAASARHQTAAILLFAGAVLLLCLALIKGANLWMWLHNLVMGLFGVCAYILPVLMGYIAVIAALERPIGSMRSKLWQCLLLLVMIGSAIHIFTVDIAEGQHYFKAIAQAWKDGTAIRGSGVARGAARLSARVFLYRYRRQNHHLPADFRFPDAGDRHHHPDPVPHHVETG